MNRERNEQFMRARFDLSQDDQTCMFSEHAHHLELANRDEQDGEVVEVPWWLMLAVVVGFSALCGGLARFVFLVEKLP